MDRSNKMLNDLNQRFSEKAIKYAQEWSDARKKDSKEYRNRFFKLPCFGSPLLANNGFSFLLFTRKIYEPMSGGREGERRGKSLKLNRISSMTWKIDKKSNLSKIGAHKISIGGWTFFILNLMEGISVLLTACWSNPKSISSAYVNVYGFLNKPL